MGTAPKARKVQRWSNELTIGSLQIYPLGCSNNDGGSTRLGFDTRSKTEIKTLLADEDSNKKGREVKSNAFRFRC